MERQRNSGQVERLVGRILPELYRIQVEEYKTKNLQDYWD